MIDEGPVFSSGSSFRAIAEQIARSYRANVLKLNYFDKYGHILTDADADEGFNFLPSLQKNILSEVINRNNKGKGVDLKRTTKNILSSQAMCFNLFAPLNHDKNFAAAFFNALNINTQEILDGIEYEYTPSKHIFNDQSGVGGVDCDALVKYLNNKEEKSIIVIETKYVEPEFSICGFRKNQQQDKCPDDVIIDNDFSVCRYHSKKKYNYWKVAEESSLFNMNLIKGHVCPFGNTLWQLWTNMSLSYAIAKELDCINFQYAVICHSGNIELSNGEKIFDEFKKLLINPEKFIVIYLDDIKNALDSCQKEFGKQTWADEFIERFCWRSN